MINRLITAIEKNPVLTLKDLAEIVHNEFNDVCINTIKNMLDTKLFTMKNTRNQINNMNLPANKVKKSAYIQTLYDHRSQGRMMIFIDETNFNIYTASEHIVAQKLVQGHQ